MNMSELCRKILDNDIQESSISTGDAYRISHTLSMFEEKLAIAMGALNSISDYRDGSGYIAICALNKINEME